MYKNLKAEMIKQNISIDDISKILNVKKETARRKVNNDIGISIDDCRKIASLFKTNNSIDYLFTKEIKS